MALPRAGALQRAVRRCAALGDAEDNDYEGLLGVAEREVAAIGGRGGPAALARAVADNSYKYHAGIIITEASIIIYIT